METKALVDLTRPLTRFQMSTTKVRERSDWLNVPSETLEEPQLNRILWRCQTFTVGGAGGTPREGPCHPPIAPLCSALLLLLSCCIAWSSVACVMGQRGSALPSHTQHTVSWHKCAQPWWPRSWSSQRRYYTFHIWDLRELPPSTASLQVRLPPACAVSLARSGHGNPSLPPTELPMHVHQGPALEADPFQTFPSVSTHLSHIVPFRVLFPSL